MADYWSRETENEGPHLGLPARTTSRLFVRRSLALPVLPCWVRRGGEASRGSKDSRPSYFLRPFCFLFEPLLPFLFLSPFGHVGPFFLSPFVLKVIAIHIQIVSAEDRTSRHGSSLPSILPAAASPFSGVMRECPHLVLQARAPVGPAPLPARLFSPVERFKSLTRVCGCARVLEARDLTSFTPIV